MPREGSPWAMAEPAMESPELGQPGGGCNRYALIGRVAQRVGRLTDVVLKEPRFGKDAAQLQSRRASVPAA